MFNLNFNAFSSIMEDKLEYIALSMPITGRS